MERLKPHSLPSKPAMPTDPEAASTGTANRPLQPADNRRAPMPATAETEPQAIISDATQRLAELQAVRDILLPDAADPAVAAELAQIASQIKTAVAALDNDQSHPVASTAQPTHAAGLIQAYDDRALSHSRPHAPPQAPPPGRS